jgi:hypothetical protein
LTPNELGAKESLSSTIAIASGMFDQFIGNINNVDQQFIVENEEKFFEKVYL